MTDWPLRRPRILARVDSQLSWLNPKCMHVPRITAAAFPLPGRNNHAMNNLPQPPHLDHSISNYGQSIGYGTYG